MIIITKIDKMKVICLTFAFIIFRNASLCLEKLLRSEKYESSNGHLQFNIYYIKLQDEILLPRKSSQEKNK